MDISIPISGSGHTFLRVCLTPAWQLFTQKNITAERDFSHF